jgi:hypothetical protein
MLMFFVRRPPAGDFREASAGFFGQRHRDTVLTPMLSAHSAGIEPDLERTSCSTLKTQSRGKQSTRLKELQRFLL